MITTENQARKVIAALYGDDFSHSIRFIKRAGPSLLIRPSYEVQIGLPTIAWRKLASGKNATVWLGLFSVSNGSIDWNWKP